MIGPMAAQADLEVTERLTVEAQCCRATHGPGPPVARGRVAPEAP